MALGKTGENQTNSIRQSTLFSYLRARVYKEAKAVSKKLGAFKEVEVREKRIKADFLQRLTKEK